jgi:hypothetical protein
MKKTIIAGVFAILLYACNPKQEKPIAEPLPEKVNPAAQLTQDSLLEDQSRQTMAPWKKKPITTYPPAPPPTPVPVVTNPPAVMYVEFNGTVVSGTNWNTNGDITCSPSGLTVDQIKVVMDSADSRFRRFNFNGIITTDKTVYDAAPASRRGMCIVTTTSEWFGASGGVALRNTFGTATPCFVFSKLLNYRLKYIWEDVPHEFGHTFGLYDEFGSTGTYCYCSIMGCGYYMQYPNWSVHNNMNDTLVIQSKTN